MRDDSSRFVFMKVGELGVLYLSFSEPQSIKDFMNLVQTRSTEILLTIRTVLMSFMVVSCREWVLASVGGTVPLRLESTAALFRDTVNRHPRHETWHQEPVRRLCLVLIN